MAGLRRLAPAILLFAICLIPLGSSVASENIVYGYDARGRLIKVSRTGTVNNGVSACYYYDPADNRTNVTVAMPNSAAPSFSVNDVSVTEGGVLSFTVAKCGPASSSFSVNFATADGTAAAGTDYTASSGTLAFAAADTIKSVTVATTGDTSAESLETLFVNLSAPTGGSTIGDGQGVGRITDND